MTKLSGPAADTDLANLCCPDVRVGFLAGFFSPKELSIDMYLSALEEWEERLDIASSILRNSALGSVSVCVINQCIEIYFDNKEFKCCIYYT